MSKNNLVVKVSRKTKDGVESWEGTVSLPGVAPTKLTKSKGSESKFNTRSALTTAAQKLAARYGFGDVEFEGATDAKKKPQPKKKKAPADNAVFATE